jgi:hypothetical protein
MGVAEERVAGFVLQGHLDRPRPDERDICRHVHAAGTREVKVVQVGVIPDLDVVRAGREVRHRRAGRGPERDLEGVVEPDLGDQLGLGEGGRGRHEHGGDGGREQSDSGSLSHAGQYVSVRLVD